MPIHFMLAPNAQCGATIRKQFAKIGATNVKIGTFDVLLELLFEYWLISPVESDDEWRIKLSDAALKLKDAFWAKSLKVDEKSVIDDLDETLILLLNALSIDSLILPELKALPESQIFAQYYNDLKKLHEMMAGVLPDQLSRARLWYQVSDLQALEEIIVYTDESLQLYPWQAGLIQCLQSKNKDQSFDSQYLQTYLPSLNSKKSDLNYLQTHLFAKKSTETLPEIKNIQWLVARDVLQEIEVLAGMVQHIVKSGDRLDDIAIIIPKDGWYKDLLSQTFNAFNIPLSRLGQEDEYTDIGTQWIFDALQCQQLFASPMSLASLLTSPLMPFSFSTGQRLAQLVLKSKINEFNREKLSDEEIALLDLVLSWGKHQPLTVFIKQLEECFHWFGNGQSLNRHKKKFTDLLDGLSSYLQIFPDATIELLLNQVHPKSIKDNSSSDAYLDSVHILYENDLSIENIKHLFVLGFNDGHYPSSRKHYGVFSQNNWHVLAKQLSTPLKPFLLQPQEQHYEQAIKVFKRQLQCASDSITFMASALDLQGDSLSLSASLNDMAFCFYDGSNEQDLAPEDLLIKLEEDINEPFFYSRSDDLKTQSNKKKYETIPTSINFSKNLFECRKNDDGSLMPESPSSFEKIMLSPLAWLLYRQGLEPKVWPVQTLDAALQGTIAHGVFEDCFCPENLVSQSDYNLSHINENIQKRIQEYASFLSQPQHKLDYEKLCSDILKAAKAFQKFLNHTQAKVIKTEEKLSGILFDIPIAGRSDALLEIGDKNLVLDYKKSGSSGRITRMEKAYDRQLYLYQQMLKDPDALTAYYTMNDATLVIDDYINQPENHEVNIAEVIVEGGSNANALALIKQRISELKNGEIKLNTSEDDARWKKQGVTAKYTLEISPLIQLFMADASTTIEGEQ